MNTQNSCWTATEHEAIEQSAMEGLWRLVYQHTAIHSAEQLIGDFTALDAQDLSRLANVHLLMSSAVADFFSHTLPALLNRLKKTSEQYHEVSRDMVRGKIDWPRTMQHQLTTSSSATFVTHRKTAVYDLLENQVLNYVLRSFLNLTAQNFEEQDQNDSILDAELLEDPAWLSRNRSIGFHARKSLKNVYLQKCGELHSFSEGLIEKVSRNRNAHYAYLALVAGKLKLVQDDPAAYLRDHGSEKVLLPLDKNVLYELAVLFTVLKRASSLHWQETKLSLIGGQGGPLSSFSKADRILEVFYQQAPGEFAEAGQYAEYMKMYGLGNKSRRPDILLKFTNEKGEKKYVILEVKRSKSRIYIADGFYKTLGYLKDYEKLEADGHQLKALLVCWELPKTATFEPTQNIHISGWGELESHIDGIIEHPCWEMN